jgi:hypothetical protein
VQGGFEELNVARHTGGVRSHEKAPANVQRPDSGVAEFAAASSGVASTGPRDSWRFLCEAFLDLAEPQRRNGSSNPLCRYVSPAPPLYNENERHYVTHSVDEMVSIALRMRKTKLSFDLFAQQHGNDGLFARFVRFAKS